MRVYVVIVFNLNDLYRLIDDVYEDYQIALDRAQTINDAGMWKAKVEQVDLVLV